MRVGLLTLILFACAQIVAGCVSVSGPTLTERQASIDALYDEAQAALAPAEGKKPDYRAAASLYERAARMGSPKAAYALAALYRDAAHFGLKPSEMEEKSFFWMKEAATGGLAQAQYELAVKYAQGSGTEEDRQQGLKWLEQAGENHHPLAQRFLGTLYLNGSTRDSKVRVKPDAQKAAEWYLKAARNDDGPSQAAIGYMYMTGRGVKRNIAEAEKWNSLAAKKGDAGAQRRMVTLSKALEQEKGSGQVKDILFYRAAYEKGDMQAGFDLGRLYYYSPAPNNNVTRALKLFRETASKVPAAALMLGVAAEEGKGVRQNFAEAVDWYTKAAASGIAEANAYLASAYFEGRGVPANETEALRLLTEGAARGDAKCQSRLAQLYFIGKDVPRDYEKAFSYAQLAADGGDAAAMNMLGGMYEKGVGTASNLTIAQHWFQQLAEYNPENTDFVRVEPYGGLRRSARAAMERMGK